MNSHVSYSFSINWESANAKHNSDEISLCKMIGVMSFVIT